MTADDLAAAIAERTGHPGSPDRDAYHRALAVAALAAVADDPVAGQPVVSATHWAAVRMAWEDMEDVALVTASGLDPDTEVDWPPHEAITVAIGLAGGTTRDEAS
jgi:hypothetical protein